MFIFIPLHLIYLSPSPLLSLPNTRINLPSNQRSEEQQINSIFQHYPLSLWLVRADNSPRKPQNWKSRLCPNFVITLSETSTTIVVSQIVELTTSWQSCNYKGNRNKLSKGWWGFWMFSTCPIEILNHRKTSSSDERLDEVVCVD
jgi:hypothetical protein